MTIVIALIVLFLVIPYLFRLYGQREEPGFKKEFYDNGSLKSKTPCKDGKLEGLGISWYENAIMDFLYDFLVRLLKTFCCPKIR